MQNSFVWNRALRIERLRRGGSDRGESIHLHEFSGIGPDE